MGPLRAEARWDSHGSAPEPGSLYLAPEDAKRFYDRLGSWQDRQHHYENPAISELSRACCFRLGALGIRVRVWNGELRRSPICKVSARRRTLCGALHQQHNGLTGAVPSRQICV